jgi:hypothetical protein
MALWTITLQVVSLTFIVLLFATSLSTFHKTLKIHLATVRILETGEIAARETSDLFPQLQALQRLQATIAFAEPRPAMRVWARSPDFLSGIADHFLTEKPATLLECSSGASALVVARCLQLNHTGNVYSLEHEAECVEKTRSMLARYSLF